MIQCPYCNNRQINKVLLPGRENDLACQQCGWEGVEDELSSWGER